MDTGWGAPYWVKTVEERHSHQCLVKVNQKSKWVDGGGAGLSLSRTSSSCLPVHRQTRECSSGRKVRCRRAPVGCRGQTQSCGLSLSWIIGMCARQHTQRELATDSR